MSLLMDALKKAEQAKRSVVESTGTSALPTAAVPVSPAMTLELTPYKTAPTLVAAPAPATPPIPHEMPNPPPLRATDTPHRSVPANSTAPSRLSPKLVKPLLATLVVILLLGSAGIWYYSSMSTYLQQQATISVPQLASLDPVLEAPTEAAPVVTSTAPSPSVTVKPSVKKAAVVKPVTAPVPTGDATAVVLASPAAPNVSVPAPPEPINVSRDLGQNEIFALLQQGYRAYQTGEDARAQVLYARVLAVEEHNRDALLGLAALGVRQKDYAKAQEFYSQLLTLDPRDSVAQAGFVGVTGSLDPLQQEARVRTLLEQEPNAPHLLFTYATFLMQQQRWAEASRALLSAHQGQRDNPDYAFNIAVTFDHQGQKDVALKYYALALEMAGTRQTNFRATDVRQRMQSLQSPGAGAAP